MQNEQLIRSFKMINFTLLALWTIGLWIGSILLYVIWFKTHGNTYAIANTDVTPLIGAFAILISAGLASTSVMKSIYTTKINDIEKAEKEKERKRIFAFNVMETIHLTVESLNDSADKKFSMVLHLDFQENIQTVNKLLESIFSESILPFLSESEQKNISVFYRLFIKFLFIKQLSHPSIDDEKDIEEFILLVKDYKKIFTGFSQEYIEEYKNTKES